MRAAIGPETAGILVEPVQGEGGLAAAPDLPRGPARAVDEFGLMLVFDEVQCGMGRTGKLFAHEWAGRDPRRHGAGQGLGGGFPVGACLATEKAAAGMTAGTHGSTFGGNPLAMAVANDVLDVMQEPGFLAAGRRDRRRPAPTARPARRQSHPKIFAEVRGLGLLIGLKCAGRPTPRWSTVLRQAGLLTVAAGENVVRLLPPLIIERKPRRARPSASSSRVAKRAGSQ